MRFFHDHRSCRFSPSFPHCNCGAANAQSRLDQLEQERTSIERLIDQAETFEIDDYRPRMVLASDLTAVLAGVLR